MNVTITLNIKAFKVRTAKHVIYAHLNTKGELYIGQSTCMVNRWDEHQQIANSPSHPETNQIFKTALRKNKYWTHFVIGVADDQESANNLESSAIHFYKPSLNSHVGPSSYTKNDYDFCKLSDGGREITLEGKTINRYRTQERFTDRERKTIKCRAIRKVGKSHISFECIEDGVRVSISHDKRNGFSPGDIVHISFCAKGKTTYTTTDYSEVRLIS
ncbi:GIY-YIG nuclease family protein [Vibrio lamellibrachiae]|uniref:GIY-YIG nuclease family protein n=1 Tax=Vibrio lamellibrachiae TaxID=2910253 RepID=UPI003D1048EB